ncbi:esterase-like activity of phytase family protein [Sphingomicrobium lutaoense]|uniref:Phytase-like domain-containing protein n=1 Tax=Sphingomicrobium lutaoense TaxID=515949 RepID=A0A839YZP2_9SPHN|nr:esterase-like activity of phytase family protein [Sphingomicrobium lutaoense]MBB3764589.1 hypothetical protein [Sphingomicrobium lutaoense]
MLLIFTVLFWASLLNANNMVDPPRESLRTIRFDPVELEAPSGWALHGAWTLSSDDPRLTGLSGMEVIGGELLMVSDSGRLVRTSLPVPGPDRREARFAVLRDGEGGSLGGHDSESLHPWQNGLLVGFERRHRAMLFDARTLAAAREITLDGASWSYNGGAEALVASGDAILALGESAKMAYRIGKGAPVAIPIVGAPSRITGATRLADGRLAVVMRTLDWGGFGTQVAIAHDEGERVRIGTPVRLPVSRLANMEALAATPIAGGSRLWLLSDDNRAPYLRQWLVAYDVKAEAWP